MRRDDGILSVKQRVIGVKRRFVFKDINAGAGDLPLFKASAKSWDTTTGPRASLMRKAVGFMYDKVSLLIKPFDLSVTGQWRLTISACSIISFMGKYLISSVSAL